MSRTSMRRSTSLICAGLSASSSSTRVAISWRSWDSDMDSSEARSTFSRICRCSLFLSFTYASTAGDAFGCGVGC